MMITNIDDWYEVNQRYTLAAMGVVRSAVEKLTSSNENNQDWLEQQKIREETLLLVAREMPFI